MHRCAEPCSQCMVPPMEVTICACRQCAAQAEVPDLLRGIHEDLSFGCDSVGDSADIWPIWTMPVLVLLRANQHHFPEILSPRLLCIMRLLVSHAECRLTGQLLPHIPGRMVCRQLSDSVLSGDSTTLPAIHLVNNRECAAMVR